MTQVLDVREQQVDLGGGATLHVVEGGDPQGRPVVLLHGLSDSWRSYRLVLPLLAECGRLILPDLRGHGASSAPRGDDALATMAADVTSLLDRLGGGPAVLVGHSMGSFVARRIALEAPDRVAGLVLVGGALTARNDAVLALRAELEHLVERIPEEFVERFQASCVHRLESLPEWFFRECVATSLGVPWSVWVGAVEGLLGDQTVARLREITCPTWVVGGGRDPVFPVTAQEDLARAIPHAVLRLYRHSGHSPHWEEPGRFAEDVFTFVGSVARRPETVSAR